MARYRLSPTLEDREWVRQLIHDLQLKVDDLDQPENMKLVRKAIDALYEGPIKEALMIIEEMKNERISIKVSSSQCFTPNIQVSEAESPSYEKSTLIPSPAIPGPISTGVEAICAHDSKLYYSIGDDMVISDNYEVFKHPTDSTLSLRIDAFDPFSVELSQVKRTNSLLESYIMNSKFSTSMGEEKRSSTCNLENSPKHHSAQWEERVMEVVMDYEKIFEWMIAWSLIIFSTNTGPNFILTWRMNKAFIRKPP